MMKHFTFILFTLWSLMSVACIAKTNAPTGVDSLAVTFTGVELGVTPTGVRVAFTTEGEDLPDYFQVQRSTDAQTFHNTQTRIDPLLFLPGIPGSYQYADEQVPAGTYYYRILQVDFDGAESYSEVKKVVVPDRDVATVHPVPTTARFHVQPAPMTLEVVDLTGRPISVLDYSEGSYSFIPGTPTGMYILRMKLREGMFQENSIFLR